MEMTASEAEKMIRLCYLILGWCMGAFGIAISAWLQDRAERAWR